MGCSKCAKMILNYPETTHWGPHLWTLLHGLAEQSYKLTSPEHSKYAKQQWVYLFDDLPKIIPCPDCQDHATQWIKAHPVSAIKNVEDKDVYGWLVLWIYEFHEAVNLRLGKPSFPLENVRPTFGSVGIRKHLNDLKIHIENAVKINGAGMLAWKKWNGYLALLMSYYGV